MKKYFNSRVLVSIIVLLIIGVIGQTFWLYEQMTELARRYYQVGRESYTALYNLKSIEKLVMDMETGVRGYLLTGDPAFLDPYNEAKQEVQDYYQKLSGNLSGDAASRSYLESIKQEIKDWVVKIAGPAMADRKLLGPAATLQNLTASIDFSRSKSIMDRLRDKFDRLDTNLEARRDQQMQAVLDWNHHITILMIVVTGILLLAIMVLGLALYRLLRQVEVQNAQLLDREGRLQKAIRELYMASKMKSEFLANMSHELRTPLNAIIGFAQVLQKQYYGALTEKQVKYVEYILTSGRHLLSLINDILDLSKIEAGKLELEPATFSLPKLLENSLIMVKEKAVRHRLEVILQVDPDIPELTADERKVKQIVYNLLSNAVKFTPDGGKITVRARLLPGDQVQVSVADTGIGIAPADQERIFEAFIQGDSGYTRQYEGTGLGLALVRRLVELHGGRVWVESAGSGQGSTFYFTLPLRLETKEQ
ncbi:ATP-binding protein [Moorella naiadis]